MCVRQQAFPFIACDMSSYIVNSEGASTAAAAAATAAGDASVRSGQMARPVKRAGQLDPTPFLKVLQSIDEVCSYSLAVCVCPRDFLNVCPAHDAACVPVIVRRRSTILVGEFVYVLVFICVSIALFPVALTTLLG